MATTPPDAGDKVRPDLWIHEEHQGVLRMGFRVERTLYSADSGLQHVAVVETTGFGRMLFTDGAVMLSERDERVYHEMIAHVPLFVHPRAERVLVIGGGDGGTVREVLRHPSVVSCRLVEIDAAVVAACRRHLPQTAAALEDGRVEVSFEDGVAYVARTDERYDVVLVDSGDPTGPALPLFGDAFYADVHRLLTDDGIVVSQCQSPFNDIAAQARLLETLGRCFPRVQIYNYCNLTYPGALWSFSFAGKGRRCPIGDFEPQRVAGSGLSFFYYNAAIHRAAFCLPQFQAARLRELVTSSQG
jgi:spermidine synthase